ncbi:MAG: alkaline phosphatase D family protein, partial [Burkholderiales bacterium]
LYGRTFSLANLDKRTLEHIDDFFGPLNAETVTQVIHFTRLQMITNRYGRNHFISRKNLREQWTFPTLSIHGEDNGLSDISTQERIHDVMSRDAGCRIERKQIEGFGHQDCWIGKDASAKVFDKIHDFLQEPEKTFQNFQPPDDQLVARLPWGGPMLDHQAADPASGPAVPVSLSSEPDLGKPLCVALLPIARAPATCGWYPAGAMQLLRMEEFREEWFTIPVLRQLFAGRAEGVLVAMIYGQCSTLRAGSYHTPLGGIGVSLNRPKPLFDLSPLFEQAAAAIQKLLSEQLPDELAAGVVQLPPQPEPQELRLVLGSCQYPPGMLDNVPAYAACQRLSARLDDPATQPQALVLAGDQIYSDATAGLFDPAQRDDNYRRAYERWLCQTPVKQVLRRLPLFALPDDHEIHENWEPMAPGFDPEVLRRQDEALADGKKHYARYLRQPERLAEGSPLWWQARGLPLFMADTRTERERRSAAQVEQSRIMSQPQFDALTTWLRAAKRRDLPKLVVSPAIFLPRHIRAVASASISGNALRSDGWDGYPRSMYELLGFIAKNKISNVVFLSGDEHVGIVACAELRATYGADQDPIRVHSIHTSALYAPYPFANAAPPDLVPEEEFDFGAGTDSYRCAVKDTKFFPGSSFTLLDFKHNGAGWQLAYTFDRETGPVSGTIAL